MKTLLSFLIALLLSFQMNLFGQTTITVGASGSYTTIETAYNTGIPATISGAYIIELQTDYNPSSESYPINLPQKTGASSSNTITIRPASGVSSAFNITANVTTQIFTFNGADYVIIDGRPGGSGSNKYISIENTSTNNLATTNTIQFINDATNNIMKYCTVKGSVTNGAAGSGTISFSTTTGTTGNDDNTIQYCDLTGGSSGRPFALISATTGTSGKENSGNIIENNNFYDHFVAGATSNAIVTGQYNNSFIIRNNSFYETTTLVPTGDFNYIHVNIGNNGIGYEISNNYFGGTSAECGGTAITIDGSNPRSTYYRAISMSLGASGTTTVQGNTIKNINVKSSSASMFAGITVSALLAGGTVNIGNVTGNTIGSSSGNGSIMLTSYSTASNTSYGIYLNGAGTINTSNNIVGSITAANSSASYPSSITAIYSGATSTQTINNNNIGSSSTSNSIYSSSASSFPVVQAVRGIYCAGAGATGTISGNTIANLTNAFTGTTASGGTYGIAVQSTGNYTISNNSISYLNNASLNTAGDQTGPLVGIAFTATGITAQTISGNTINNLSCTNTGSGAVKPAGIFINGPTSGTNNVYNNFIHSISVSTTSTSAQIYGIRIGAGSFNYYNNIISLGLGVDKNINIYGIYENGAASNNNNVYFNTVYIGRIYTGTSTLKTYAFYNNANTNTRNFRNNIFMNARYSTTTALMHYSIYLSTVNAGLTIDYNDYYITGTGGVLGSYAGTNKTTLSDWKTATSQDANSMNTNPAFQNAGGTNATDYIHPTALNGTSISGITTDYLSVSRAATPTMGAFERANTQYALWTGTASTDFNTAGNWEAGSVPSADANIVFKSTTSNNCVLDGNRSITTLVNSTNYNLVTGSNQLTIKGSINQTGSGKIDASSSSSSSTVIFAGSSAQSIPSGAFVSNQLYNLTINNSSGVTLGGAITVTNGITLTSGRLTIGDNNLTYSGSNAISGTPTAANMIVATGSGELRKTFSSTGSFTFPVGDNDGTAEYTPVTLNFTTGVFSSAYAGVNLKSIKHPNNSSPTDYVKRYWSVTQSGITSFTCNVTLKYIDPEDIVGTEANIRFGKYSGSSWTYIGTVNTTDNQLEATGVTSFSTFSGGTESAMPVKLASFNSTVNIRNVNLFWVTISEENNTGFDIERANTNTQDIIFEKIGYVKGSGTKNTPTEYNFSDSKLETGKYKYRLKQTDYNGNYEYFELDGFVEVGIPAKFTLSQNYPNPFNPVTKIDFELSADGRVSMSIYDLAGKEVMIILNEFKSAGYYTVLINAGTLSSGVYFYRLTSEGNKFDMTKKMVLIK